MPLGQLPVKTLTAHQQEVLLSWLRHHLPMELRCKLMLELPVHYNNWMEQKVMYVYHIDEVPGGAEAQS